MKGSGSNYEGFYGWERMTFLNKFKKGGYNDYPNIIEDQYNIKYNAEDDSLLLISRARGYKEFLFKRSK